MKKIILYACILSLVVIFNSCKKESNEPSPEEIAEWRRKDWIKDGLHGQVQKVTTLYPVSVAWDTLTQKATPSNKTNYQEVVEYNKDGYCTWSAETHSYATNATVSPSKDIVITKNEELPWLQDQYRYDVRNRLISWVSLNCNYSTYKGEYQLPHNGYPGDTFPAYYGVNADGPIKILVDTSSAIKYEYTYDDINQTATRIHYSRNSKDGSWSAVDKIVFAIDKDGYIDNNQTAYGYVPSAYPTTFEEKPYYALRRTFDSNGNWVEQFDWNRYQTQVRVQGQWVTVWAERVSNYKKREILYY